MKEFYERSKKAFAAALYSGVSAFAVALAVELGIDPAVITQGGDVQSIDVQGAVEAGVNLFAPGLGGVAGAVVGFVGTWFAGANKVPNVTNPLARG